jgi:hypothetical protein
MELRLLGPTSAVSCVGLACLQAAVRSSRPKRSSALPDPSSIDVLDGLVSLVDHGLVAANADARRPDAT